MFHIVVHGADYDDFEGQQPARCAEQVHTLLQENYDMDVTSVGFEPDPDRNGVRGDD